MSTPEQIAEQLEAEISQARLAAKDYIPVSLAEAERIAAALRRPSPEATWQPIATAPSDGSWFWVRRDSVPANSKAPLVSVFRWDADRGMWFSGMGWWYAFPMNWTHWMPLPAAPGSTPPPETPEEP